jgi:hypothetical protein
MDVFYGIKILFFDVFQSCTKLSKHQNKHLGQHNFFFPRFSSKNNYILAKLRHSWTFKKGLKNLRKLLTLYEPTQKLKKPDLELWSFRG